MLLSVKSSDHAFHLRYGWTAWPSTGTSFPTKIAWPVEAWETDGLHLLEYQGGADVIQLVVSAAPRHAPVTIAQRLKGRLQHALRAEDTPCVFSRKVALRAIGDNTRRVVECYIDEQLQRADLADPHYREALLEHAFNNPNVKLAEPSETNSGRYWYNLHLVLVTDHRYRMSSETAGRIASACRLSSVARGTVMPDHLHLAIKANPKESPECVARAFQEITARAVGMLGFWKDTYYVGTFGEYGMKAVRS